MNKSRYNQQPLTHRQWYFAPIPLRQNRMPHFSNSNVIPVLTLFPLMPPQMQKMSRDLEEADVSRQI